MGLTIFLSFLCAAYYALFIALTLSALLAALLLVRRISGDKVAWAKGALGVLVGLSPILAVLPPYLDTRATFGERELYEPHYFSASLLSYLSSPAQNLLYGFSAAFSHDEAHLSPGLLILVLCLIGFFRVTDAKVLRIFAAAFLLALLLAGLLAIPQVPGEIANYACALSSWAALFCFCLLLWRLGNIELKLGFKIVTNRDLLSIFMFCAVLSFLISLGPQGNPNKGHLALGVHRLFYEVLPGFNSIRAISRIGIFCLFFLVMCSSLVIAQLQSKKILNTALVSLLSLAVFLENYTYSFPLSTAKPRPAIFEQLARIGNSGDALVVLPFTSELDGNRQVKSWGDFAAKNTSYMNWLSGSGRPLVNGYSGQRTKIMSEFPAHLSNFPDQRSLTSLGSIVGLRYVILLSSLIHNFNPDSFRDRVEMFSHAFRYIYGDSEGHHLFEFVAIRTITDSGFHLLAPSYPRGLVSLELMTHKQDSAEPIAVSVYNKEHFGGSPIAVLKLVPDGNWSLLSFLTPETPDRVRPLRLTFRAESEVFIRHSSYEALGSAFSSE
ncbi:MAG: hypothetical protein DCC75_13285 [Proteobacteria bacterium]|nr:MAG: hypothetical protein DCC75_13285 [Pseudomonadota bacterium]